ncbi:MAG: malto-oligosyltrehalose trehalohydrolase [Candidatus Brocadia sp.]|nr:malto-oligosyltrehalose trehalohydrolase [Candidatus Brocadia sp.]
MKTRAHSLTNGRYEFTVWAPFPDSVALKIVFPYEKIIPMERDSWRYWKTVIEDAHQNITYYYRLNDEKDRPDPASHYQPKGVHGPSQVIDHTFNWEDEHWKGIDMAAMIIYEIHVGTFTPDGTFAAIIPRLDDLKAAGINALEIMPVAQFPGDRNWGYDGVHPFAVQNSYGGPEGFKRLVNECHKKGISVVLDVVYNHVGPEGNYLGDFGPYFTDKYKTPWGNAINFDDKYSHEVRTFFIENAIHWFMHYHVDALRLDAIHAIFDMGAKHFLCELSERVEEFSQKKGRKFCLIAESDLNDTRVVMPRESGGYGIDGMWCDDYHHALHTLLTDENKGYYLDFGKIAHMVKSLKEGFVYSGEYSQFREKYYGNSSKNIPAKQMIVFSQNHDQTGNRMLGERLSALVSFEAMKLAAGAVLLSPYIPLLFMGEEYGEDSPFLYFVSHCDPALIEAVRQGRKKEFSEFKWQGEPPDPQNRETFLKSKIDWQKRNEGNHKILLAFYKHLITLRKTTPALSTLDKESLHVDSLESEKAVFVWRWKASNHVFLIFNFNRTDVKITPPISEERWRKELDSSEKAWNGHGSLLKYELTPGDEIIMRGQSFVLYIRKCI